MNKAFCAWCDDEFEARTNSHIYCSAICRELASREKKAERNRQARRRKRIGKVRLCAGGCGTRLSIYNETGLCNSCIGTPRQFKSLMRELKDLIDYETIDFA